MTRAGIARHLDDAAVTDARERVERHLALAVIASPRRAMAACDASGLAAGHLASPFARDVYRCVEVFLREAELAERLIASLDEADAENRRSLALCKLLRFVLSEAGLWTPNARDIVRASAWGDRRPATTHPLEQVARAIVAAAEETESHA